MWAFTWGWLGLELEARAVGRRLDTVDLGRPHVTREIGQEL